MPKSYSIGLVGESNYQEAIKGLREGERVFIEPEPGNRYDPRALVCRDGDGATIGYIPRDHWLTGAMLDEGKAAAATIGAIEGGDAGRPHRGVVIVVELGEKGAAPADADVSGGGFKGFSNADKARQNKQALRGCLIIVVLLATVAMCTGGSDEQESSSGLTISDENVVEMPSDEEMMANEPAVVTNGPGITLAEFNAIETGMSPDEVDAIVGSPGEVVSESDMAGYRTVMVSWDGESGIGANANAMFQNGKLIQKAQFGLQ